MAEQLVFDLPVVTAFGRDDFFTSPANSLAVAAIEDWRQWPLGKLVLSGPEGSGKSHLGRIWADIAGATVVQARKVGDAAALARGPLCVENLHGIAGDSTQEAGLFHLHNLMAQGGYPLLMTGRGVPRGWGITLPDLASRIEGSQLVQLGAPDDTLLAAVLLKLCADRQLLMEPGVVDMILRRAERSFAGIRALVGELDRLSLQRKRPVGPRMVSETLRRLEEKS